MVGEEGEARRRRGGKEEGEGRESAEYSSSECVSKHHQSFFFSFSVLRHHLYSPFSFVLTLAAIYWFRLHKESREGLGEEREVGEGAESSFPELTTSRMTLQGPSECDPRRLDLDFSSAGDFFSFFFVGLFVTLSFSYIFSWLIFSLCILYLFFISLILYDVFSSRCFTSFHYFFRITIINEITDLLCYYHCLAVADIYIAHFSVCFWILCISFKILIFFVFIDVQFFLYVKSFFFSLNWLFTFILFIFYLIYFFLPFYRYIFFFIFLYFFWSATSFPVLAFYYFSLFILFSFFRSVSGRRGSSGDCTLFIHRRRCYCPCAVYEGNVGAAIRRAQLLQGWIILWDKTGIDGERNRGRKKRGKRREIGEGEYVRTHAYIYIYR